MSSVRALEVDLGDGGGPGLLQSRGNVLNVLAGSASLKLALDALQVSLGPLGWLEVSGLTLPLTRYSWLHLLSSCCLVAIRSSSYHHPLLKTFVTKSPPSWAPSCSLATTSNATFSLQLLLGGQCGPRHAAIFLRGEGPPDDGEPLPGFDRPPLRWQEATNQHCIVSLIRRTIEHIRSRLQRHLKPGVNLVGLLGRASSPQPLAASWSITDLVALLRSSPRNKVASSKAFSWSGWPPRPPPALHLHDLHLQPGVPALLLLKVASSKAFSWSGWPPMPPPAKSAIWWHS